MPAVAPDALKQPRLEAVNSWRYSLGRGREVGSSLTARQYSVKCFDERGLSGRYTAERFDHVDHKNQERQRT